MKILSIIFQWVLVLALIVFGVNWLFNHVSPWIAVAITILAVFIIVQFISNKINKTNEKN